MEDVDQQTPLWSGDSEGVQQDNGNFAAEDTKAINQVKISLQSLNSLKNIFIIYRVSYKSYVL